jgi:hypothetical protein
VIDFQISSELFFPSQRALRNACGLATTPLKSRALEIEKSFLIAVRDSEIENGNELSSAAEIVEGLIQTQGLIFFFTHLVLLLYHCV